MAWTSFFSIYLVTSHFHMHIGSRGLPDFERITWWRQYNLYPGILNTKNLDLSLTPAPLLHLTPYLFASKFGLSSNIFVKPTRVHWARCFESILSLLQFETYADEAFYSDHFHPCISMSRGILSEFQHTLQSESSNFFANVDMLPYQNQDGLKKIVPPMVESDLKRKDFGPVLADYSALRSACQVYPSRHGRLPQPI